MLIAAVGARQDLAQFQVTRTALTEQQQPIGLVAVLLVTHPQVATDDGLQAFGSSSLIELDQAEHVADIGQREAGHAVLDRMRHGIIEAHDTVGDRILAVQAKVDELRGCHGRILRRLEVLWMSPRNRPRRRLFRAHASEKRIT